MPATFNFEHVMSMLLVMGLINYIATVILTQNMIFEDVRNAIIGIGERMKERPTWAVLHDTSQVLRCRRWPLCAIGNRLDNQGSKRRDNPSRLGPRLKYLPTCPMCMGVWIGFTQAGVFGGPLDVNISWAPWIANVSMSIVANGLLFKAVGHFFIQLGAILHHTAEFMKARATHFLLLNEQLKPEDEPDELTATPNEDDLDNEARELIGSGVR